MERTKSPVVRSLIYVALILFFLFSTIPFAWTALNSIKTPRDANSPKPEFIGFEVTGDNYTELWLNTSLDDFAPIGFGLLLVLVVLIVVGLLANHLPVPNGMVYGGIVAVLVGVVLAIPRLVDTAKFYDFLLNSFIVTIATTVISISIGCLAGYALARYSGLMSVVILVVALAFRALPGMAFVLPFYYLGQLSGLYDTHFLVILVLVAGNQPFTIWMLRSFFMEIPQALEEAAWIDGASRLQAFIRVIIPIMWPGIITTGLFTLLSAYNAFLIPRLLTQTKWTLPVAIVQFTGGEDPGHITLAAAASVSITLPIVFVIIFFQKYLVKGLGFGAVKG
ncbi:MAG: carbohydrate ABC transporter permease [Anaerolineales bacterium]|nr:carbohydrate ABC transporter permease [Anaerolineales bacterium]